MLSPARERSPMEGWRGVREPLPTLCGIPFRGAHWRSDWLEPGLSLVYTVNAEFLYWARRLPPFLEALQRGDCTADGRWVVWLLNLKYGGGTAEHLPGSRLIHRILEHAERRGLRVALVGATPEVLRSAAERARALYGVREILTYAPGRIAPNPRETPQEVEGIERFILEARPDILFLALGPPKQELVLDMLRDALARAGVRLAMGVGGSLNMLAGKEKLAPSIVSRLGMEWLWRLAQNPRRARKVARSFLGLTCALREAIGHRLRGGGGPPPGRGQHASPRA